MCMVVLINIIKIYGFPLRIMFSFRFLMVSEGLCAQIHYIGYYKSMKNWIASLKYAKYKIKLGILINYALA